MTPTLQGDCLIKEITKKWLEEKYACTSGIDWFTKQSKTDSIEVLNELIKQNRLEWANWLIVRVMDRPQYLAYAIFAAEQVIDIFERKYPDDKRARLAIEASRAVLENDTAENRSKAKVYCYSLNFGFAAEWAALAASTASVFAAEWAASTASLAAASSWSVWTTWASAWSKWAYSRENAWASAKSAVQSFARGSWANAWSCAKSAMASLSTARASAKVASSTAKWSSSYDMYFRILQYGLSLF